GRRRHVRSSRPHRPGRGWRGPRRGLRRRPRSLRGRSARRRHCPLCRRLPAVVRVWVQAVVRIWLPTLVRLLPTLLQLVPPLVCPWTLFELRRRRISVVCGLFRRLRFVPDILLNRDIRLTGRGRL